MNEQTAFAHTRGSKPLFTAALVLVAVGALLSGLAWAGDGLLAWKTVLGGHGRVAINAPGPVEKIAITDGALDVQGRLVLGRTAGLRFRSIRAARFPRNLISGQKRLRRFEGTGHALVCWTPYWNEHMYQRMTGGESLSGSLFE